jgi:hypothetical protein
MENQPIRINELENHAQRIIGGRIVRGNLKNYDSFSVSPMTPLALIYGSRVTIETNGDGNKIYVDNQKYRFKADRLAEKFVDETGDHWEIIKNFNKKQKKKSNFWKNTPI